MLTSIINKIRTKNVVRLSIMGQKRRHSISYYNKGFSENIIASRDYKAYMKHSIICLLQSLR